MKPRSKDLFSDTTMSFGEHLEALRSHLWRALAGVALGCVICLFFGTEIVNVIRWPLDQALEPTGRKLKNDIGSNPLKVWWDSFLGREQPPAEPPTILESQPHPIQATGHLQVEIQAQELWAEMQRFLPTPPPALPTTAKHDVIKLTVTSPEIELMQQAVLDSRKPVALSPQEPFMIYLKVSGLAGLVIASPWVFYQLWLFIAAGLYMHERKYMYLFGSLSLILFVVGVMFCFWLVLPLVLKFLMQYNDSMNIKLEPRLSEYLTFASILPLMFGIGFQLPLIMVFFERMSLVTTEVFIKNWRIAVFVIAFLSMLLTPPEPISMVMMMGPMVALYFLGILLCKWTSNQREVAAVPSV